jgi:hypothetical protein
MKPRKPLVASRKPGRNQGEKLKDEVYRQMFRLEEDRPGAEMGLALALLRAWLAADSRPGSAENRDWLKKVSPICLQMIEADLKFGVATIPCAKGHSS